MPTIALCQDILCQEEDLRKPKVKFVREAFSCSSPVWKPASKLKFDVWRPGLQFCIQLLAKRSPAYCWKLSSKSYLEFFFSQKRQLAPSCCGWRWWGQRGKRETRGESSQDTTVYSRQCCINNVAT